MAPFNKRQIGYIQAIAGRQQHTTLICKNITDQISSDASVTSVTTLQKPQALDLTRVYGNCGGTSNMHATAKSLLLYNWTLDNVPLCHDSRPDHNDDALTTADLTNLALSNRGAGVVYGLDAFNAAVEGTHHIHDHTGGQSDYQLVAATPGQKGELVRNPDLISSTKRATTDGFLNSTNIKFRFTLPRTIDGSGDDHNPMGQDHFEFRWIVWRNKMPTFRFDAGSGETANLDLIRKGASFRNPNYDLFMGQTGRKRGLVGYTYHPQLDKDKMTADGDQPTEKYSGRRLATGSDGDWVTSGDLIDTQPDQEELLTVDDLLTMPLNKTDYVVMKDVRFFLGKEHGKSHFEDTLHWDWNDPIDTPETNVLSSPTLNDKNYRWMMTLIGTSGGQSHVALNYALRATTKMESG